MEWLALPVSFAVALAVVPAGIRALEQAGLRRENYAGREVAFPLGAVLVAASLVALAPLAPLDDRADLELLDPELRRWFAYVVGVALLGLLDDSIGRGADGRHGQGMAGARARRPGRRPLHRGDQGRGRVRAGRLRDLGPGP